MSQTARSDQPIDGIEALQRKLERLEAECELLRGQLNAQEAPKAAPCRVEPVGKSESDTARGPRDIADQRKIEAQLQKYEQRFQAIMKHAPVEIILKDTEGRYIQVSRNWERNHGHSSDAVVGKTASEVLEAEYGDVFAERDRMVLDTGETMECEELAPHPDGTAHQFLAIRFPISDSEGKVAGLCVIAADIDERKRAEQALRESEEQLRTITDNLPVFIAYTDRDERLKFANKTVGQWYARPAADMLGKKVKALVSAKTYAQMKPNIATVLSGNAMRFEEIRAFPDGVNRHLDVSYIPDLDKYGQVLGWFSLLQDITERKRLEAKLLQKERQAGIAQLVALEKEMSERIHTQELSRQRQEELNHVSRVITINELGLSIAHEVNQPLSVISSQAQLCRDALQLGEIDRGQLSEWVKKIISNADRAAEIVRRIRNYSRKQKLEFAPVDVKLAIAETVDILRSSIDSHSVTLDLRIDESLPKTYGDYIELQQVIINLVQNALEAMADVRADRRKLKIAAYRNDRNMVAVAVTDTGPGIPADRIEAIFKPFVTTKEDGLGMGLSISSSIVESFGGRLWAVSDGNKETTFFVTLPVVEETP